MLHFSGKNKEPPRQPAGIEKQPMPHKQGTLPLSFPARLGRAMKTHQHIITAIQWGMIMLYLFLLLAPACFPLGNTGSLHPNSLPTLSVLAFWGIGWPLIMLSSMLFGRFWCGVCCPEGALTETISWYGQHRLIPRWIRWPKWPALMWLLYSLSLALSGAAHNYNATAVILGIITLAAMLTGFLYGNGRRIWCMYLCPANAAFRFSARLALLHFRVDQHKWQSSPPPSEHPVFAPLIPVKQMKSAAACHACGRCSGYREAVDLAARKPGAEILSASSPAITNAEAFTLLFSMPGLSVAALFLERLTENALPITSLPARLGLLATGMLLAGAFAWSFIRLACRTLSCAALSWKHLSLGLIPLAGILLFLGPASSAIASAFPAIGQEKILLCQLPFLAASLVYSLWLGWPLIRRGNRQNAKPAMLLYSIAPCGLAAAWTAAGLYL